MALKDITLGQYFPGSTIIHRLDPRTKLLCTTIYIVALFLARSVLTYGILMGALVLCILLSKVKPSVILQGLKPVLLIILITALLNLFYTPGEPIVSFWVLKVSREGIWAAVSMILRISLLITCTFLLTYTTSPILLTDGIEKLLNPL
ncbi:MAG: energy-coupling factor transporter transmembrane protein EcfT, partial [Clostridiales bacterium]|nr:energy-coupling factor transporter transmembrane protein EcfT [Clostridiales bacterium]